jgi:hypothetical protein
LEGLRGGTPSEVGCIGGKRRDVKRLAGEEIGGLETGQTVTWLYTGGRGQAAVDALRSGRSRGQEGAIEDAGTSAESAMKVLLDERGVARTGKEAAWSLFVLLRDEGVDEAEAACRR